MVYFWHKAVADFEGEKERKIENEKQATMDLFWRFWLERTWCASGCHDEKWTTTIEMIDKNEKNYFMEEKWMIIQSRRFN